MKLNKKYHILVYLRKRAEGWACAEISPSSLSPSYSLSRGHKNTSNHCLHFTPHLLTISSTRSPCTSTWLSSSLVPTNHIFTYLSVPVELIQNHTVLHIELRILHFSQREYQESTVIPTFSRSENWNRSSHRTTGTSQLSPQWSQINVWPK